MAGLTPPRMERAVSFEQWHNDWFLWFVQDLFYERSWLSILLCLFLLLCLPTRRLTARVVTAAAVTWSLICLSCYGAVVESPVLGWVLAGCLAYLAARTVRWGCVLPKERLMHGAPSPKNRFRLRAGWARWIVRDYLRVDPRAVYWLDLGRAVRGLEVDRTPRERRQALSRSLELPRWRRAVWQWLLILLVESRIRLFQRLPRWWHRPHQNLDLDEPGFYAVLEREIRRSQEAMYDYYAGGSLEEYRQRVRDPERFSQFQIRAGELARKHCLLREAMAEYLTFRKPWKKAEPGLESAARYCYQTWGIRRRCEDLWAMEIEARQASDKTGEGNGAPPAETVPQDIRVYPGEVVAAYAATVDRMGEQETEDGKGPEDPDFLGDLSELEGLGEPDDPMEVPVEPDEPGTSPPQEASGVAERDELEEEELEDGEREKETHAPVGQDQAALATDDVMAPEAVDDEVPAADDHDVAPAPDEETSAAHDEAISAADEGLEAQASDADRELEEDAAFFEDLDDQVQGEEVVDGGLELDAEREADGAGGDLRQACRLLEAFLGVEATGDFESDVQAVERRWPHPKLRVAATRLLMLYCLRDDFRGQGVERQKLEMVSRLDALFAEMPSTDDDRSVQQAARVFRVMRVDWFLSRGAFGRIRELFSRVEPQSPYQWELLGTALTHIATQVRDRPNLHDIVLRDAIAALFQARVRGLWTQRYARPLFCTQSAEETLRLLDEYPVSYGRSELDRRCSVVDSAAGQSPKASAPAPFSPLKLKVLMGSSQYLRDAPKTPYTVGSAKDCDLTIRGAGLEPAHCRFDFADGRWIVVDLTGGKGLWVGGKARKQVVLTPGSQFKIAERVRFEVVSVSELSQISE